MYCGVAEHRAAAAENVQRLRRWPQAERARGRPDASGQRTGVTDLVEEPLLGPRCRLRQTHGPVCSVSLCGRRDVLRYDDCVSLVWTGSWTVD